MTFRARATGLRSRTNYDFERKEIPDPHYVEEISTLERSLADRGKFHDGGDNTRARLKILRAVAPYFDGRRMIKDTPWWPCRCGLCVTREALMGEAA